MADTGFTDSGRYRDDVKRLVKDVYYGNGKPGITTRVQLLEDAVERIGETLERFNKLQDKIVWLLVGTVALAVLNLVIKH